VPLFLAFLIVPLIEIALFIQVGGIIGLWMTLAIVVLTAILGANLVRQQGAFAMGELRSSLSNMDDPTEPLAHGAMIIFAGALLLTPGFFTDTIGFSLLIPKIRHWVFGQIHKRITIHSLGSQTRPQHDETIIDAEYEDLTDVQHKPQDGSGWTKH